MYVDIGAKGLSPLTSLKLNIFLPPVFLRVFNYLLRLDCQLNGIAGKIWPGRRDTAALLR